MLAAYTATFVVLFISHSLPDASGYGSFGVSALKLDPRLSQIWEENRGRIHEIAQQRLCKDGSAPTLQGIQHDGQLTTYDLGCEEKSWRNVSMDTRELYKRQTMALCATTCAHLDCYSQAARSGDQSDCAALSANLKSQNTNWYLQPYGTKISTWGTCMYTFDSKVADTVSFCDSKWASIGDSIAPYCRQSPTDTILGGICSNGNFYVEAKRWIPDGSVTTSSSTSTSRSTSTTSSRSSTSTSTSTTSSQSHSSSSSTTGTGTTSGGTDSQSTTGSYQAIDGRPGGATVASGSTNESPTSGATDDSPSDTGRKPDIAAIVGGTIGTVAAVALLLAVLFIMRRVRQYEKMQSENGDQYIPTHYVTNPDPFTTPHGSAFEVGVEKEHAAPSPGFRSMLADATSQGALTDQRDHPPKPPTQIDTAESTISDPSGFGSRSSEDVPPPVATVPAPTVEALIAAAAPPELSQQQIDLFAANFVSLMRGRQPLDETSEEDEEDASGIRQPPPYQQQ